MTRRLPNLLTIGRLALSVVFFALLAGARADGRVDGDLLLASLVIYVVAGVTDVLDGWLARRWNVTSTFGRLADPIVDKVIVCGAFAMLAGRNFAADAAGPLSALERQLPA